MRRFYSPPESFTDGVVTLSPEETRHLRDVLRLRPGDTVRVFDGAGTEFETEIIDITKSAARMAVIREVESFAPESALDLTLAVAMLKKSDKFDLVVQKAVELGVSKLIPLETVRSEVRPRDPARKAERWRRIALEATKQCGRARLMKIDEPIRFAELSTGDQTFFFTEIGGSKFPDSLAPKKITAIVGPEGGWADADLKIAADRSYTLITLGGRILRAETAAIAITAVMQHRFGDLN